MDPEKTQAMPQKTASMPEKTAAAPTDGASPSAPQTGQTAQAAHKPGDSLTVNGTVYTVEQVIGSGSEGDIYVVSDAKGRRYALKLFHPGRHPNAKVLQALEKMKDAGILIPRIHAWGPDFELMEYISGGSAARARLRGNAQAITAIVIRMAIALDALHKAGVVHKDVKPANILVRDLDAMDFALCDFGIADVLDPQGRSVTPQVRTPIYAAPEVYKDAYIKGNQTLTEFTPKADFYSLGMTALSLWMGEDAFLAENQMAMDKIKGRIAVPPDMPDPLARIVRGLLIVKPEKRWNLDEIERTVRGEDVEVDEEEIIEDLDIVYNASKHLKADTPKELAACMDDDWELAAGYLYRGQIEKWLTPYPELALKIHDITENRFPLERTTGVAAVIYLLDRAHPLHLTGLDRKTREPVQTDAVTLKDVSDFYCKAETSDRDVITSDIFREWVRVRSKDLADRLPTYPDYPALTFLLRIQTIDPLSDIQLINDPSHPDYAMTGEGLGRFLNRIYSVFWNRCGGDLEKLDHPIDILIAKGFLFPKDREADCHYLEKFFATKGSRFDAQRQWLAYCLDWSTPDRKNRCGPSDSLYRAQVSWMQVIKGFGFTPQYEFPDTGDIAHNHKTLFSHSRKELRREYRDHGLQGFLAILNHENPDADLSAQLAYETLLKDYLDDVREIDPKDPAVVRFDEARDIADDLLREGKGKIRRLNARNIIQYILLIGAAVLPALALLVTLVFAIIEHPTVNVSDLDLWKWTWTLGIILGGVIFFTNKGDGGCLASIIGGVIVSGVLMLVVWLLGPFILYIYAALVAFSLVYFSIKTLFFRSIYADKARKFMRPGFDEQVLEPLYYAFSNEDSFDSSLNGAFNDDELDGWKGDLKVRSFRMWLFIGVVWIFMLLGLLVPRIQRFEAAPPTQDRLQFESLAPGDKGEDVTTLQIYLKEAGYFQGTPSPTYGPATKKAVQAFQKANGLPATGVADPETVKTINKLCHEMQ